ncbi:MAG: hypothetical protein ACTSPN_09255 [Promethearchaeota archaeon]
MIDEKFNNYMHKFIEKICNDVGPRESGTEQELQAGDIIEEEFKQFCDEAHQEEYVSSPHAFLGGIRYGAMLVCVSIILYWMSLLIDLNLIPLHYDYSGVFLLISIILIIFTVSYFILEVIMIQHLSSTRFII